MPSDQLQVLEDMKTQQLIEYHRQYLTLSYPVTNRFAAANSNPALAWSAGVQMAPMMLQGAGRSALLAHAGRFAQDNGGCGFVLKASHLRQCEAHDYEAADLACKSTGWGRGNTTETGLSADSGMTQMVTEVSAMVDVPKCTCQNVQNFT